MLIRSLEIEIGRKARYIRMRSAVQDTPLRAAHDCLMRRTGIEPDVESICQLAILRGIDAEILMRRLEPRFDATGLDLGRCQLQQGGRVRVQNLGFFVDEERQGHAPLTLARQRPVGTTGDHAAQPGLAPRWKKLGGLNAPQRRAAQRFGGSLAIESRNLVHAGKPLRRRPIDDGRSVAPAMHVAVSDFLGMQQRSYLSQLVDDLRIRVPDLQPAEVRKAPGVATVTLDRIEYLVVGHAVTPACIEVVDTIGRRAVDDAGALLQRHKVAEIDRRCAVVEGVTEPYALKRPAIGAAIRFARCISATELVSRKTLLFEITGQNQCSPHGLNQRIQDRRIHVQRLVRGNRPRRRGPDNCNHRAIGQGVESERRRQFLAVGIVDCESDIDGDILPVLVLDFRFGQGTLTVEAPVHRLESAVQVALLEQLPECANLVGFVAIRHGRVRMLPIAEHPEPLELGLLAHDLFAGIGAA